MALDRYTMRGEKEGVCLVVGRCVCECVCVSVCSCILVSCVMCPHVCVMSVAVFRPPVSTQREKRVCEPPILPESNHGAPYLLQRQVRRWRVRVQVCTVPSCFLFPSVFPVWWLLAFGGGFPFFFAPCGAAAPEVVTVFRADPVYACVCVCVCMRVPLGPADTCICLRMWSSECPTT